MVNRNLSLVKLSKRVDQNHSTMELFAIELVSNLSAQLFPDNTLSSFTNFLPEQMKLEGQWEVAISEISCPSRYQNVTEGKFTFFDSKLSNSSEYYYLEPGLYHSITDIVEVTSMLIQERHNHTETSIAEMSRRTQKKKRFASQMKDRVLHSLVRTWVTFLEAMLAMTLGYCWEGKDLTSQCLLMTVRIQSLLINTDLIEYNMVGDTKAA